ncbi:hypothetical protein NKG05_21260 [Oerskovia sp. M15]
MDRMVASSTFEELWIVANRQAHRNLVSVLTGEGTPRSRRTRTARSRSRSVP